MDVILLRKFSRKSIMEAGIYMGLSVQDILNLKKNKYLRHMYYMYSNISFLPDILDEIGITDNLRIEKPGKSEEMFNYVNSLAEMSRSGYSRFKSNQHFNKVKKYSLKNKQKSRIIYQTKGYLQSKNQGH